MKSSTALHSDAFDISVKDVVAEVLALASTAPNLEITAIRQKRDGGWYWAPTTPATRTFA